MTSWLRNLLFILAITTPLLSVGQNIQSPEDVFQAAKKKMASDKKGSFDLFVKAMQMSLRERKWHVYGPSVADIGKLRLQNFSDGDSAFHWTEKAIIILKKRPADTTLANLFYNAGDFMFARTKWISQHCL